MVCELLSAVPAPQKQTVFLCINKGGEKSGQLELCCSYYQNQINHPSTMDPLCPCQHLLSVPLPTCSLRRAMAWGVFVNWLLPRLIHNYFFSLAPRGEKSNLPEEHLHRELLLLMGSGKAGERVGYQFTTPACITHRHPPPATPQTRPQMQKRN